VIYLHFTRLAKWFFIYRHQTGRERELADCQQVAVVHSREIEHQHIFHTFSNLCRPTTFQDTKIFLCIGHFVITALKVLKILCWGNGIMFVWSFVKTYGRLENGIEKHAESMGPKNLIFLSF
jgi:hypothetical protein